MSIDASAWLLVLLALLAANLPWLSERALLVVPVAVKTVRMRLLEWLILYFLVGGIALGLENKAVGGLHSQDWEFYAVTLCLFMVFAFPGFIYRHDVKHHLESARRRRR